MKPPSIEDMELKLGNIKLMANGIRQYIYALEGLEQGQYPNSPFFDILMEFIKEDNKDYGTFDNSELYTNIAYLCGLLDVYEKQVEHLSDLFGEGTNK